MIPMITAKITSTAASWIPAFWFSAGKRLPARADTFLLGIVDHLFRNGWNSAWGKPQKSILSKFV
jgi:hypothetical protein